MDKTHIRNVPNIIICMNKPNAYFQQIRKEQTNKTDFYAKMTTIQITKLRTRLLS